MNALVNFSSTEICKVMYPKEVSTSAHIQIPKCRRRYNYSSSPLSCSPVVTEVSCNAPSSSSVVQGCAHLCFSEDGTWFEGHLTTTDESQYGMIGKQSEAFCKDLAPVLGLSDSSTESTDTIAENLAPNSCVSYDVTVLDHDDEQTYTFQSVILTSCNQPMCTLLSSRFKFTADKAYRGQKADMLIQRYLTPRLVGNNLRVYAGHLTFDLSDKCLGENLPMIEKPLWRW